MKKDLKAIVQEKGIEYFLCSFVEMSGIPKAKLVPAERDSSDMVSDGAGFAGFAAGNVGQGPADRRLGVHVPDMQAMIQLPWRKECRLGSRHAAGRGSAVAKYLSPKNSCPSTGDRARKRGYELMVGSRARIHVAQARPRWRLCTLGCAWTTLSKPCYDMRALHRNLDLLTRLVGLYAGARMGTLRGRS